MPAVWQLSWSLPEAFQPDFEDILTPFWKPFCLQFGTILRQADFSPKHNIYYTLATFGVSNKAQKAIL